MNSVHETGPNGDSETLPSRKTRSKTKPVARAHNWPSWPSLRAQAAPRPRTRGLVVGGLAVSWPSPPAVSQASMAVSQGLPREPACRLPLLPRAPRTPRVCLPVAPLPVPHAPAPTPAPVARPVRPSAYCLRASWPYRGLAGHCIAIQSSLAFAPQSQYTSVYCDTTPALS